MACVVQSHFETKQQKAMPDYILKCFFPLFVEIRKTKYAICSFNNMYYKHFVAINFSDTTNTSGRT